MLHVCVYIHPQKLPIKKNKINNHKQFSILIPDEINPICHSDKKKLFYGSFTNSGSVCCLDIPSAFILALADALALLTEAEGWRADFARSAVAAAALDLIGSSLITTASE